MARAGVAHPSEALSTPDSEVPAWSRSWQDVGEKLGVDPKKGLSEQEVGQRSKRFGSNRLREARRASTWKILVRQFESLIVLLLLAAAAVALAFGQAREAITIAVVIAINTAVGFVTEWKAVRSMEALRQLGRVRTRARRDGVVAARSAWELVPGDVVILEAGDLVPADVRLVEVSKLQTDESVLTGESMPVKKASDALDKGTPLAERRNMLYRGTAVTRGSAEGIVVATGMRTEIGRIAELVYAVDEEKTPLERRLDRLGARLVWVTLALTGLVVASGVLAGKDLVLMIETGIALAVATIPEGLPIVATAALARGMWRMARRNALVNRLAAVEALGSTTIICSDKTGTLTENRMTVTSLVLAEQCIEVRNEEEGRGGAFRCDGEPVDPESTVLRAALEIAVLCNNADVPDGPGPGGVSGDPLEVALLVAGRKAGLGRRELLERMPEVREEAFVPDSRKMATFHADAGRYRLAVKGAPEAVVEASTRFLTRDGERSFDADARRRWLERNARMADDGLRVLALATKVVDSPDASPYEHLVFVGLVGLLDPPRTDVRGVIEACRAAGIRIVMVTGDQAGTALAIGKTLGLVGKEDAAVIHGEDFDTLISDPASQGSILEATILSRVSPEQKLDLIALHQKNGAVVAMTGDGVNDAPALKKADIGIAMGKRGTQVAAEAADIVLRDDAFSTIVMAVEQGRIIFDNIRNFVLYLLSCNVSEVLVVAIASLFQMPLPITPLQILFLNLVTDVFPALALGVGEGDEEIMRRPPRDPKGAILTREDWLAIAGYGALLTACVLGALLVALHHLDLQPKAAVTVSFLTLAFAQLWHTFNMRSSGSRLLQNEVVRNRYVWGALLLCVGLLLAAVYIPSLAAVVDIVPPDRQAWKVIAVLSALPLVIGQLVKTVRFRHHDTNSIASPNADTVIDAVAGVE